MSIATIKEFLRLEASAGIILVMSAALALVLANSPLLPFYQLFLDVPVAVQVGALEIAKPLLLWVNDGLMAVFFFLVGLEIKREVRQGELSTWSQASLPCLAAIGGMAVPALIYVLINLGDPVTLQGWAIPAATDIAFALGVLALLGNRVPPSLKIFLLALAIMDDLGAIVIIAIFYTADLSVLSLALAGSGLVILALFNLFGVMRLAAYLIVGLAIWVCVLKSGVHATLAGVAVAFFIPLKPRAEGGEPLLKELEHMLHPWVAFMILPFFAFANAGVSLQGLTLDSLLAPVPLGIAAGLFIGKQVGVFGFTYATVRYGLAPMPQGTTWLQIYGLSFLTGIGFTMSLFIGTLAFDTAEHATGVRLGVLIGSLLSAVGGYLLLRLSAPAVERTSPEAEMQRTDAEKGA
ncbi:MAG: Na+/H+ antiporter NhaA [Kiloniellales bacterium]|nr:Na+/H+ antiporter NhaA [Kiloniellales bacterium]